MLERLWKKRVRASPNFTCYCHQKWIGNKDDKHFRGLPILQTDNRITIKKSQEMIPHWLFIDGKNFRLEKGHLEEKPFLRRQTTLIIWNATKPIADMLQAKYEQW